MRIKEHSRAERNQSWPILDLKAELNEIILRAREDICNSIEGCKSLEDLKFSAGMLAGLDHVKSLLEDHKDES